MKKIIILSILLASNVYAFSLNPNTGKGFDRDEIDVYVGANDCSAGGFTTNKYVDMIKNAVEDYWNATPTSALYLNVKGIDSSIDLSSDTHETGLAKTTNNTILAGCNDSAQDFDNGSTLGSAVMSCSGDTCKAILILNIHSSSPLIGKSQSYIEAVIAHELGHAFGLGHSKYEFSLMYYSAGGKYQKWLGQDDIDGVTYLYPHDSEFDLAGLSLIGNCGSLSFNAHKTNKKSFKFFINWFLGFSLLSALAFIIRKVY